jgi:hypothetical protein
MDAVPDLISSLPEIPIEHLIAVIALGALALAACAIQAVTAIAADRKPE